MSDRKFRVPFVRRHHLCDSVTAFGGPGSYRPPMTPHSCAEDVDVLGSPCFSFKSLVRTFGSVLLAKLGVIGVI